MISRAHVFAGYVLVIAALLSCTGDDPGAEGGEGGASTGTSTTTNATATANASTSATSTSNTTNTAATTNTGVTASTTATATTSSTASTTGSTAASSSAGCDVAGCTGDPVTSSSFGDASFQMATAVAANAQGDFVVAFTGGSPAFDLGNGVPLADGAYVAKLDETHTLLWSHRLGVGVLPTDVAMDDAGEVTVVGHLVDTVDLGTGPITPQADVEGFVLRLSDAGAVDAVAHFGTDGTDPNDGVYPESVDVDAAGNTVLSGHFFGDATFGGAVLSTPNDYGGFIVKLDASLAHVFSRGWPGRSYVTVDVAANGDILGSAGYLTRLDSAGNDLFDLFDPNAVLTFQRAAFDASGNVLVTGWAAQAQSPIDFGDGPHTILGSYDGFVVKRDPAGSVLWSQQLGHVNSSVLPQELAVDDAGDVIVTGLAQGGLVAFAGPPIQKASVNRAAFLVKLSGTSGAHVWSRAMFGPGIYDESQGQGAAIRAGNPLVVGNFKYQIDLGGGLLTCNGGAINSEDVFIAEYAP